MAEGLDLPSVFNVNEKGELVSDEPDMDAIFGLHTDCVNTSFEDAVKKLGFCHLDTSHTYPGFARIVMKTVPYIHYEVVQRSEGGKSVTYLTNNGFSFEKLSKNGPAMTDTKVFYSDNPDSLCTLKEIEKSMDIVQAMKLREWPSFMKSWRSRQIGPTVLDDMIENNEGCYLVKKAHPHSSDPEIEWRFSFSMPELILARNLTITQRRLSDIQVSHQRSH